MSSSNPNPDRTSQPVCLIGNLTIDLIINQVPELPVWGQEVLGVSHSQVSSGQAGYTAFALRGLGVPVSLISLVGDDLYGQQIQTDLQKSGVDLDGVSVYPGGQTGITVAIVRADGERAFVSNLGCSVHFGLKDIAPFANKQREADIVGVVGIFNLPGFSLPDVHRLFTDLRAAGKTTMLDSGWDPQKWQPDTLRDFRALLGKTTLFMPNWDEARAITGADNLPDSGRALLGYGAELVVIKNGEEGSYVFTQNEESFLPALEVEVHDAVGAGDTFNAGFITGYRQGWRLKACLALGNAAAAIYISRSANRFPSLAEALAAASPYGLIPPTVQANAKPAFSP
ncbi:MAG: hypothetical protein B6D39_04835 [Anaerolineae bacterium UTCFX2]|jgi:ribokinase|nr:MAG: hypothetical protein B6D39_04835 [Anaerolineae bacterium UTCFX2]